MIEIVERERVRAMLDEGAQLVEVLPEEEYREEHIAGAINIPLKRIDETSVEQLDRTRPVIVYCYDYQ